MVFGVLEGGPSRSKARKPATEPTLAEVVALLDRWHPTVQEARHAACRALRRPGEWQRASDMADALLRRPASAEECAELEAVE
jgi:hypothetical protein